MGKEMFINISQHEKRVAVLEDKRIEEFYTERSDYVNLVGNVYKGRVDSVLQGMGAAFVDIGLEKNGFLYVADVVSAPADDEKIIDEAEDQHAGQQPGGQQHGGHHHGGRHDKKRSYPSITELLKKGDDVLVQVVKEPIGTKGARLTTHISIPGRFLVMMPFDNHIGISKRIESREERDRIRTIIRELKLPEGIGFIVRTAAQGVGEKEFARESKYLMNLWNHIKGRAKRARPPQLIHQEYDIVLRVTRDLFTSDFSRLEIDSKNDFRRVSHFLRILAPHLRDHVKLYTDHVPLFEKFEIEKQIEKVYDRTVQMKSGGYLIFDQTESLVAIDVNSGKFVGRRNLEDTVFKTNMEAAHEIPRQLKLRDIGGIIIIDFIDMESHEHRKTIFRTLERNLENDKAKTNILNISSIGLVEMTRQRVRKSMEGKSYQKCPYCSGRGLIKTVSTVAIELIRRLERVLAETRAREVTVSLHPEVAYYCIAPERNMIMLLEKRFRKSIKVIEDPSLHIEDINIEHREPGKPF